MSITHSQLTLVLGTTAFYLIGQLSVGTNALVASLVSVAILFGLLSIFAGGGIKSAYGCLNAVLIGKFLLIGIAIKIAFLQPSDDRLGAPLTTSLVMAIGFIGLFVGTLIQAHCPCPQVLSMNRRLNDSMLISLSIVLFVTSYGGYFASLIPASRGAGLQTGGWLGIARSFGSMSSLSIVPPMLYLWRRRARLWMTHPAVLGILSWSGVVGVFSTAKQAAMEPLLFYVLIGFLRYGWRDLRLWSIVSMGIIYYEVLVFPYSQYVRDNGGRQGTLEHRAEVTKDTFLRMASDGSFRSSVTDRVSAGSYFGSGPLSAVSRLAMVAEADRLIGATERQHAFTGWETITWGFRLVTPSILYPKKPVFEAGNYLAHIVGEVGSSDSTTEVSYGVMANLYNAFAFAGVAVGTPLFFAGFYYWIRIFIGDPMWERQPTASALWFIWFIASFHHVIVESSLSGVIASLLFPAVLVPMYALSQGMSRFFRDECGQG